MAKTLALIFGVVFVVVGVLGFFPNPVVGMNGIFMTNMLHNVVHLVIGIVLLIVAFAAARQSALWLKIFGVVYLLLAVLGFVLAPTGGSLLGVQMNMSDHWLHVVLGIVLLIAGFAAKGAKAEMPMQSAPAAAPAPAAPGQQM